VGDLTAQTKNIGTSAVLVRPWSLIERMHVNFNDREAHTYLPIPIARFREAARKAIYEHAKQFNDVKTVYVNDS
jgi:hypothetical protein